MEVRGGSQSFMVFKPQRDDTASFGRIFGIFTVRVLYPDRLAAQIMKASGIYTYSFRPLPVL
jgi:hypothetical protein